MPVILQESLRAVFYAPFYAALALGAYEEEGVDVTFTSSPRPADAARRLLDGTVDVTWGGPMRVMLTYDRQPDCDLVCFGEVVTRDPFFVLGREARAGFRPADLAGLRFGRVSEVETPWLCLQHDVRLGGADPAAIRLAPDRPMAENLAALGRGELDAAQVFQPFAEAAVETGAAHIWYAAASRGPTSYTTFYAPRRRLAAKRDELAGLVRAIYRVQKWVAGASGAELAAVVQRFFPDLPPARLAAALGRYKALGLWGHDPRLPRAGYDWLRAARLRRAGARRHRLRGGRRQQPRRGGGGGRPAADPTVGDHDPGRWCASAKKTSCHFSTLALMSPTRLMNPA
jgi:NitT/TauT family transport system substrate-binding protein